MQQFHDDVFKQFPRRTSDIHPNIDVFEEYHKFGPTRGEWLLVIAGLLLIAAAFVLAFFMFT